MTELDVDMTAFLANTEQQQTVVTEPQPVVAEPLTEKTPEEEKKAKRLEQLKAARIAKRKKKHRKRKKTPKSGQLCCG